jgi:acetyl esterase/lipase
MRTNEIPVALASTDFCVRDLVYARIAGKDRLARLYRPQGAGPFPAIVLVHGGAWNLKDRTDGQATALDLCNAGILVLSLDFRNAPEAPYPASLQDINLGIRWLKAHAEELGTTPDRVGLYGTSSGGHQALVSAIRPHDERYSTHTLAEAPQMDATAAFVISGWGVLFPWDRYNLAKAQGKADMLKNHHTFFGESEAAHVEATPALILERGEKVHLPPALQFQGDKDEWTSVEQAERLAAAWRARGGQMDVLICEGERHTFLNEHPVAPNSVKALAAIIAFVKKHAG